MPIMDGFAATSAIRANERINGDLKKNVIVALTANALEGDRERCLAAGMDDYLSKPVSTAELRHCLVKWLPEHMTTQPTEENNLKPEHVTKHDENTKATQSFVPKDLDVIKQTVLQDVLSMCAQASEGFFENLVSKYKEGSESDLASIKSAISNKDSERLRTASHRLKSSSANLGGERVANLCQQLENAGGSDDLSNAAALSDELHIEIDKLIDQISVQQRAA